MLRGTAVTEPLVGPNNDDDDDGIAHSALRPGDSNAFSSSSGLCLLAVIISQCGRFYSFEYVTSSIAIDDCKHISNTSSELIVGAVDLNFADVLTNTCQFPPTVMQQSNMLNSMGNSYSDYQPPKVSMEASLCVVMCVIACLMSNLQCWSKVMCTKKK
jgi:hypothetical protein